MSTELELRFVFVAQIVLQQGCGKSWLIVKKTCSEGIFIVDGRTYPVDLANKKNY
ncbi:MAG: hypothetical protein WCG40_04870 [Actinomycetes bacterium]